MDWIIGGNESHVGALSFDTFFDHQNRWGVRPAVLERLFRRDIFGDAVAEVMANLRRRYQSYSDLESHRAWCFALHHRQRYHISCHAWSTCFGAWPLVPAVDMELLAVAGGLPAASLDGRRLQIELVCSRFPKLARLPLDRNSYNSDPLLPSFAYRVRRALRRRAQRALRSVVPAGQPGVERRRYYRQFDVNGPGWRSIREAVEPHRRLGYEYLNPAVLDELVPPPQAQVQFNDAITGSAGMKSILGFLLWLRLVQAGETAAP
jgi:asparagine synthase (glutamine-hydrolysing)